MKEKAALPPRSRYFVEKRKELKCSVIEFAILLGISTEEVILFECGKKHVYDWVYEKLIRLTSISVPSKTSLPNNCTAQVDYPNREYDTKNPLLAIFNEVQNIQKKLNTNPQSPKKRTKKRRKQNKKDPNQLSLMLAIKEANELIDSQTDNECVEDTELFNAVEKEVEEENKAYLLGKVHTELNKFNKHFNHYLVQYQTPGVQHPSSLAIFYELKQIRDNFIRELFNLQKEIKTEELPFIDLLSKIDVVSNQYHERVLLKFKELTELHRELTGSTPIIKAN